jgi:hypothetical protein
MSIVLSLKTWRTAAATLLLVALATTSTTAAASTWTPGYQRAHYCKQVDAYRIGTCAKAILPAGPLGRQLGWVLAQLGGEAATLTEAEVRGHVSAEFLTVVCCPRPGSPPSKSGICGPCCATGRPWSGCRPHVRTGCTAVLADRGIRDHSSLWTGPGRAWLADLELPATPRGIIQDCGGLLDALATPIGRREREIAALAKPDHGSRRSWPCPASSRP